MLLCEHKRTYANFFSQYIINNGREFKCGARQGDSLSGVLFNLAVQVATEDLRVGGSVIVRTTSYQWHGI